MFLLGLYWRRMATAPAFWSMLTGAIIAGGLTYTDLSTMGGVPGGLIGLAANVLICVLGSLAPRSASSVPATAIVTEKEARTSSAPG